MVDLSRMLEPAAGFARSENRFFFYIYKLTITNMKSLTFENNGHCTNKCSMTTVTKLQINTNHIESVQKVITYLGFTAFKKFKKVQKSLTL